jgi:Peptidase family M1 domain
MVLRQLICALIILYITPQCYAQQPLTMTRNLEVTFEKGTRSKDGRPGKNYWQNKADYTLNVNFNPATLQLSATETIEYSNNSPDTLYEIWFKLYPNLYKKGALRSRSIADKDVSDGVKINSMTINSIAQDSSQLKIDATNMTVDIDPLLPGKSIQFSITYGYTLNKGSHIRTGEIDPGSDFVAYFFPRIAVYDDIDGWNKYPYTGAEEFYNDFCNFKASITVPKNYVVWATGNLLNCNEVLNNPYCERIQYAEKNDSVTTIIDISDLQQQNITANNAANTWKFEADDVTDFAFATSDHYIWQSSSLVVDKATGRRTRVDAVFNPAHKNYFQVIDHARATVQHMSYDFPKWPYPYAHETVFDGLDQMEYPMMVNDNPLEEKSSEIELTDHEIFHTMFPFYMGINETKYGWMDEGWATIGEWLISPMIDSSIVDKYGIEAYEMNAGTEVDVPIKTLTPQLQGTVAFFLNSYPKPAFGYLYVKDMLGDTLFTKALHYYIEHWHGKHPMPYDFFNCINEASGFNLDWFWKRWFFDDGIPDLAISKVTQSNNNYTVIITSKGNKPVPVDLAVHYTDNTTLKIHRTISVWEKGNTTVTLLFTATKPVQKLELGSTYVPDINKTDNEYIIK